jgi:hypothetical protein
MSYEYTRAWRQLDGAPNERGLRGHGQEDRGPGRVEQLTFPAGVCAA